MIGKQAISLIVLVLLVTVAFAGAWTAFAVQRDQTISANKLHQPNVLLNQRATTAPASFAHYHAVERGGRLILPMANTSSSSASPTVAQTMVYLAGLNYTQAAQDYAKAKGVNTLAPQVYALDQSGNLILADPSFNATLFTSIAHAGGLKVIPLVMAGGGLCITSNTPWCNDNGIASILQNSTQLSSFTQQLVSLCNASGFDGIQPAGRPLH